MNFWWRVFGVQRLQKISALYRNHEGRDGSCLRTIPGLVGDAALNPKT